MYQYVEGRDNMINPISFRAIEAPILNPVKKDDNSNHAEVVTNPISNEASFKGADALAAYNKAFLAVDTAPTEKTTEQAPAFKGEEPVAEETAEQAPAFKGEEPVAEETAEKAPAFKGEEPVAEETAEQAPAFKGEEPVAEEVEAEEK